MRYVFIRAHAREYAVSRLCRVLEVSKAGYYAWRKRAPSERDRRDRQLRVRIRAVHAESRRTYGSPRVHADLGAQGITCSRKRVERLMREEGLRARVKRRFRITTDSRHPEPIAPNVLDRRFSVEEAGAPDRIWVTDITYIPTSPRARGGSIWPWFWTWPLGGWSAGR